jgi:hypothetical protein
LGCQKKSQRFTSWTSPSHDTFTSNPTTSSPQAVTDFTIVPEDENDHDQDESNFAMAVVEEDASSICKVQDESSELVSPMEEEQPHSLISRPTQNNDTSSCSFSSSCWLQQQQQEMQEGRQMWIASAPTKAKWPRPSSQRRNK